MKLIENLKYLKSGKLIIASVVLLSIGFSMGGYFVGNGIYQSMNKRTVTVKGLSEKDVVADMAIWNIKISRVGGDLSVVQSRIDSDMNKLKSFLKSSGFSEEEVQNLRIQVRDKFAGYSDAEQKSQKSDGRYVIENGVMVRSGNVQLVDSVSRKLGDLVRQGVTITEDYTGPMYIFNGLNDIKISMIEQSTKNATDAGLQFAKDSGSKLGKIQNANQGTFSVESRDPTDPWSSNEKQSIYKKVRVVSTITFYLQ